MTFKDPGMEERRQDIRYAKALDWSIEKTNQGKLDVTVVQMRLEKLDLLKRGEYQVGGFDMKTFEAIFRFQKEAGFKGNDLDGKWGNKTDDAAEKAIARLEKQEKAARMAVVPKREQEPPARKTGPYTTPEATQALLTRILDGSKDVEVTYEGSKYGEHVYRVRVQLGDDINAHLEITVHSKKKMEDLEGGAVPFARALIEHNGTTSAGYIADLWLDRAGDAKELISTDTARKGFTARKFEAGPRGHDTGKGEPYYNCIYVALAQYDPAKKEKGS